MERAKSHDVLLSRVIDETFSMTASSARAVDFRLDELLNFHTITVTILQADSNSDEELMSIVNEMTNASWHGLLAALSLLLDASQDETARELVLKSHQDFASLCGALEINIARDAFINALCKASLPPHYDLFITGIKHTDVRYFPF